jgi:hypothetical protein
MINTWLIPQPNSPLHRLFVKLALLNEPTLQMHNHQIFNEIYKGMSKEKLAKAKIATLL